MVNLISFKRKGDSEPQETFIDRYVEYGWSVTDAPRQYHVAGGAIILSAIICPHVTLPARHTKIRPNIWAMILAGTTVTRKSTSMDLAVRMLGEVLSSDDFLMGTDGSPEGILTELQARDGKASLFHRDEITGFIEAATKKEYNAGMLQSLTSLYDGRQEKRTLRSGNIDVKKPRLILWCGGIKSQMQEVLSIEQIRSGFIPRFIVVSGTTTSDQIRPIGPPVDVDETEDIKAKIVEELYQIVDFWMPKPKVTNITLGGTTAQRTVMQGEREMTATPDAWDRMRWLTHDAVKLGENSSSPDIYTPMYVRLADSIIKVAMLLAGSRCSLVLEFEDVCQAIRLADVFLNSATEFARAVEESPDINLWEKKADKILAYMKSLQSQGGGPLTRSEMMRKFHVKAKDLQDVEMTLIMRGQIKLSTKNGMNGNGTKTARERVEYYLVERERITDDTLSVPAGRFRKETPYS
jgi:hypothetical protein